MNRLCLSAVAVAFLWSLFPAEAALAEDDAAYENAHNVLTWIGALAFDSSYYFSDSYRSEPEISGILDGYSGLKWSFGVKYACPHDPSCDWGQQRLTLRLVRWRKGNAGNEKPHSWDPKSFADVRDGLASQVEWLEADLSQCRGALKVLRRFGDDWYPQPFPPEVLKMGREPGDIIVTADGNWITLKSPHYQVTRLSEPTDWAFRMLKAAEPCLKPSSAPAPWLRKVDDPIAGRLGVASPGRPAEILLRSHAPR